MEGAAVAFNISGSFADVRVEGMRGGEGTEVCCVTGDMGIDE